MELLVNGLKHPENHKEAHKALVNANLLKQFDAWDKKYVKSLKNGDPIKEFLQSKREYFTNCPQQSCG